MMGGRYTPSTDSWTATPTGTNCPSARQSHTAVWTGQEMIVLGGSPYTSNGGIYYPNTPPRSLPALSTSLGADATFCLGVGETLSLNGSASTDGSNPSTTPPYHDQLDSIVSYEWYINRDASFGTECVASTSSADRTGVSPAALTEFGSCLLRHHHARHLHHLVAGHGRSQREGLRFDLLQCLFRPSGRAHHHQHHGP